MDVVQIQIVLVEVNIEQILKEDDENYIDLPDERNNRARYYSSFLDLNHQYLLLLVELSLHKVQWLMIG